MATKGLVVAAAAVILGLIKGGRSIGCYVCASYDGSNPDCEDPFNTTYLDSTKNFFRQECQTSRKGRNGLFPASVCVKVKGKYWGSGKTLMMRTCAVDSNSYTMDCELARIEHSCGQFQYAHNASWNLEEMDPDDIPMLSGCIDTCSDVDGCNDAPRITVPAAAINSLLSIPLAIIVCNSYLLAQ